MSISPIAPGSLLARARGPRAWAAAPFVGVLLAVTSCAPRTTSAPVRAGSDARAVTIADQVLDALGGRRQWDQLRGLRWTFGAEAGNLARGNPRHHAWDKWSGWHRVQGTNRAGQDYVIIDNLNDGKGMAWVAGTRIEGDSLAKLLARGKSMWINDSYWFLMPYKLLDPGVTLKYAGDTTVAGNTYDRLALSFDHVGETPGDHYWVYVNRKNHRVQDWEMVLQGDQPPPAHYTWEGWEQHASLWFPTAHRDTLFTSVAPTDTTHVNIFTRDVETVLSFPAGTFDKP